MAGARSAECKCESNFTCGYCLRNRKPYFYTLHDGSAIYEIPVQNYKSEALEEARTR